MRTLRLVVVSCSLGLVIGCETPEPEPQEPDAAEVAGEPLLEDHEFADPEVTRVHSRMVGAMAPDGGWERARYLEFDWVVDPDGDGPRRSNRFDRWEGRALVEMSQEEGDLVAAFPVDEPASGTALRNGEPLEGQEAVEALEGAHRAHINDSYWLLMPYKWADPGVSAEYLGQEEDEDGREWEVVQLEFDDVGLTPQNVYRAFVDPESGLMGRWHHYGDAEADPSPADWTGWERFGPIQLATRRERNGDLFIGFENIRVEEEVPEGALDP